MFSSVFPLIRNCSIDLLRLLLFHPWGACATDLVGPGHRLERCRCFATGPVPQCKHVWTQGIKLQHVATPSWLTWSARCLLQSFFSHSSVICRFHGIYINLYIALILLASCCTHIGGPGLSSFVIGICLTAAAIVRALASACTVAIFELAQCWAYQDGCALIPGWITGQLAGRQLVGRSWPSRTSMSDFACLRIICTSLLLFLG